ncbi:hypothetical protein GCM10028793_02320 [Nocardiopsis oceani]
MHRIRIVLEGTLPPIWRRVEVPEAMPLSDLHTLVQAVMGWQNAQPHFFEFSGRLSGDSEHMGAGAADLDETTTVVSDVLGRGCSQGTYTYDPGDDWLHVLTLEEVGKPRPDTVYPRVLDGWGGCPPEDCGGLLEFDDLRELRDHPELFDEDEDLAEEQREWVSLLAPDDLDIEAVQQDVRAAFGTLPEEGTASSGKRVLPARPVSLPDPKELAESAERTEPLRGLLRLAQWAVPHKRLTAAGTLHPAEVRHAVEELDLPLEDAGHEVAERGEQGRGSRASGGLPDFQSLWRTAVDLGLIHTESGTAFPAPELLLGKLAPATVLDLWVELFEAAVSTASPASGPGVTQPALRLLYEAPDNAELSLSQLAAGLRAEAEHAGFPLTSELGLTQELVTGSMYQSLLRLADTGGVRLVEGSPGRPAKPYRPGPRDSEAMQWLGSLSPQPVGQGAEHAVVLTPLGRYGTRQALLKAGVPAPLSQSIAESSAAELLDALRALPRTRYLAEIKPWVARRTGAEAVREIAEATADSTGGGAVYRALGISVLSEAGEQALPELHALLRSDRPMAAGLAAGVLLKSRSLTREEHEKLLADYGPWQAVDAAAGHLVWGEDNLVFQLTSAPGEAPDRIGELLLADTDRMWKIDHPATVPVLEALGRLHPDKKVAKEARRAAYKARSRR